MPEYGFLWTLFWDMHCVKSKYSENLRIQPEYRKIQTRKNSVFGHFSRSETSIEWKFLSNISGKCYIFYSYKKERWKERWTILKLNKDKHDI